MAADNSSGGGGFDWSGLFSGIENTAITIAKITSAPTDSPQTGTYNPIPGTVNAGVAQLTSGLPLFLLLGFGVVLIFALKKT
jgi:hypothetical protein